ncbi:ATP-binding cassette domain-containing protein [Methylomonas sp. SURF-2]|uniref:ATP-binding cassette domain-containing protein n=1 Tax=Methylomonas subterranea TaxID=2952225 RepID=A0ABT1TAJ5_9GAMM|nr:ATP-binding cassette domain-containing protein [Methylomonas sp. SURF-2]MCQ8102487.1 ATP-binding cassette domain-containing protein [Methylomonas sp. SURF-2]
MSSAVQCDGVWKRYGRQPRGIKELLVGRHKADDSRYSREWALRDINFAVERGSAFGIVGHNGTGKSTLLSLLLGTIPPDRGNIRMHGRVASMLELGAGFHPELTGRENIFLYGSILGMSLTEIRNNLDKIIGFSELDGAIDNQIRTYSSGMIARLGFSTIAHTPVDILLIDEVLAVGDSHFQEKCGQYLQDFKARQGTLVIVSHDMEALAEMCDSGICLNMGHVLVQGSISNVLSEYEAVMTMSRREPKQICKE